MVDDLRFPKGFYWGTATSSHQVEGNNRNNDWWRFEQEAGRVKDGTTSGPGTDHYNRFDEDFALSEQYGHNAHRFSIEWSRIEPEEGRWDEKEVEHYRRVVDSLHKHNLVPFATLHHFTHPIWFADMGSWTSDRAPELLGRYAGYISKQLGDAVPFWMTINEPPVLPMASYIAGVHPPAVRDVEQGMKAARNILKSLATMHNGVRENTPHKPKIGPVINMTFAMPASDSEEDRQAAKLMDQYWNGYWLDGFRDGVSGPPAGSGEEVPGLKGAWDFVGLNYYSRNVMAGSRNRMGMKAVPPPPDAECSTMGWQVYPEGFYQCMMRLKDYGVPIYVTENGIGTDDDEQRISYLVRHLYQVDRAIKDGVDVRSYLHWCQQDNFEWAEGYRQKFGLFEREEGTLNRIPKPSASVFKEWSQNNAVSGKLVEKYVKA